MNYSWKGHKDRDRRKSRIHRSGFKSDINSNIPVTWRWARGVKMLINIYCLHYSDEIPSLVYITQSKSDAGKRKENQKMLLTTITETWGFTSTGTIKAYWEAWGEGGGDFYTLHLIVTLSPPELLCIKVGSCVGHFNVSLIVWAMLQDSVHKPQFWKRMESRSGSNRGPLPA